MTPYETALRLEIRVLMLAAALASLPLLAAAASAQQASVQSFTDPAQIDRAVVEFTGVPTGEVGGARVPADRRLRLSSCASPLDVTWHGRGRATVQVACAGPQSWRIFIATRPIPQSEARAPIVSRGDPITVIVRGRGFSVQQSGEALEAGREGEWIAIRTNPQNGRDRTQSIRARIERPGLAIIPAS